MTVVEKRPITLAREGGYHVRFGRGSRNRSGREPEILEKGSDPLGDSTSLIGWVLRVHREQLRGYLEDALGGALGTGLYCVRDG